MPFNDSKTRKNNQVKNGECNLVEHRMEFLISYNFSTDIKSDKDKIIFFCAAGTYAKIYKVRVVNVETIVCKQTTNTV